ncbi:nucleotide exchange factor GrpE [Salibacterium halotolerans]|uniref:Protein GrpE n=1 Tax=Salibacterium halotolerans TaxID=1884432 RepID=A0A1I5NGF9_9BACI|nr:nucleotide exchange factor GrpE [Salibacterium halotolerans]SFP20436.1 molecular chaperone GrpE [Salibacterium halotolerans]
MKENHTSTEEEAKEEEQAAYEDTAEAADAEEASVEQEDTGEEEPVEESELEKAQREAGEWQEKALRVQADLDNVRRRAKEDKERDAKYRSQSVIESLLPVLDNFERALDTAADQEEDSSLLQGVNMVYSQLFEALQQEGLEMIPTEGETFDPHQHQAVMQVEEEGFESNQIVEELQKGYKLKDKVIRPAMVKVNA